MGGYLRSGRRGSDPASPGLDLEEVKKVVPDDFEKRALGIDGGLTQEADQLSGDEPIRNDGSITDRGGEGRRVEGNAEGSVDGSLEGHTDLTVASDRSTRHTDASILSKGNPSCDRERLPSL
jgi:hypothetical protein